MTDYNQPRKNKHDGVNGKKIRNNPSQLVIPNIKEYQDQWLMHKRLMDKLIEQLQGTKEQCNTLIDIIKPIKKQRNIFQSLSDTTRTHVLTVFDRIDDTVQDIEPTSDECIDKFNDLIQFFDILLHEASKYDGKEMIATQELINKVEEETVYNGVEEEFLDHEAHLKRRKQYAEVIVDLEEYLTDAQKQCNTISAALRNGASEIAKSDDKTEWLSITTSINRNADKSLTLIHQTLEESLREIKTAGILLMQNDKQIERYQEQLRFLTSTLDKERIKYHDDIEMYSGELRKQKDQNAYLNEELQHERAVSDRRQVEVRRGEKEIEELTQRLDGQTNKEILQNKELKSILSIIYQSKDEQITDDMKQLLSSHFNQFESCYASEQELRYKCKELSRHLDDSKMRRQYEKCNYKKKIEQMKNSWDQEKIGIENRHNMLIEKLQDEIQLWRSTNGSSNFDVQVAMEQMEDALHEAHIQIRDKDDEIQELRDQLQTIQIDQHQKGGITIDPNDEESKQLIHQATTTTSAATSTLSTKQQQQQQEPLKVVEMRKGMELYQFLYNNLTELQETTGHEMHESLVFLNELKHELELYGGLLSERDYAIEILENRLNISQNATQSINQKYNKLRHKFLKDDDDSDNVSEISDLDVFIKHIFVFLFLFKFCMFLL